MQVVSLQEAFLQEIGEILWPCGRHLIVVNDQIIMLVYKTLPLNQVQSLIKCKILSVVVFSGAQSNFGQVECQK